MTQVAGMVIYALTAVPGPGSPAPGEPLARLTPRAPVASVPVVVLLSRCDGHARAETKKPYAFLVWVAARSSPESALTPQVSQADRTAFAAVCPL